MKLRNILWPYYGVSGIVLFQDFFVLCFAMFSRFPPLLAKHQRSVISASGMTSGNAITKTQWTVKLRKQGIDTTLDV